MRVCVESCAGVYGRPAWPGRAGPRLPVQAGPGPAGWWGVGGSIYQATRRLYRTHKTPFGASGRVRVRLFGGSGVRVLRCRFQSPPQCHQQRPPVRARVRVRLMQAGRVRVPLQAEQAWRVRRGPPAPLPVQSGEVRRGSMLPALPWSGAVLRSGSRSWPGPGPERAGGPGPGPARAGGPGPGPARPFPKATAIFPPPTPGRKFPAIFPARYFTRTV